MLSTVTFVPDPNLFLLKPITLVLYLIPTIKSLLKKFHLFFSAICIAFFDFVSTFLLLLGIVYFF